MAESRSPRGEELSEVDFKFFDYLQILWRAKWVFLLVMAGATAVAFARTRQTPPRYEATCSLVIMESEALPGGGSSSGKGSEGSTSREGQAALLLTIDLYRELAGSNRVMNEILRGLQLDQPPYNFGPDHLRPMIRFNQGGGDRLFNVTSSAPDPALAQKLANFMGQALVSASRQLKASRYATMQESLEAALATVKTKMDETVGRLDSIERKFSVATRKSDFDEAKTVLEGTGVELQKLSQDIAETTGRLHSIRENLASLPAASGQGTVPPSAASPSGAAHSAGQVDEVLSGAYGQTLSSRIKLEETLGGLTARRKELTASKEQTLSKLRRLELDITRIERQLGMIKLQYEVLSDSYRAIGRKLEETRVLAAADIVPGVIVIDPAPLPASPIRPDLRRNITRANLFAFALTAFGVLVVHAVRKKRAAV